MVRHILPLYHRLTETSTCLLSEVVPDELTRLADRICVISWLDFVRSLRVIPIVVFSICLLDMITVEHLVRLQLFVHLSHLHHERHHVFLLLQVDLLDLNELTPQLLHQILVLLRVMLER